MQPLRLLQVSDLHMGASEEPEARGLHVIETDEDGLSVTTYAWSRDGFAPVAERRLPLGRGPLPA